MTTALIPPHCRIHVTLACHLLALRTTQANGEKKEKKQKEKKIVSVFEETKMVSVKAMSFCRKFFGAIDRRLLPCLSSAYYM